MIDVLHIYKDYAPVRGGIENHVRALAEAQAARGLRVAVCACAPADGSAPAGIACENGVEVHRLPRIATLRSMPLSLPLWRAACRLGAASRIVHVHSPFPLGEAAVRTLPPNVLVVATHHSDVVRQRLLLRLYAPLYRAFLRRADLLLPTSDAYARSSPWLRPHLAKCRTVPLGVDTDRFHPPPPSPALFPPSSAEHPPTPSPALFPPSSAKHTPTPSPALFPPSSAEHTPTCAAAPSRGCAARGCAARGGAARGGAARGCAARGGAARGGTQLLFVGRLRYYKGLPALLDALRLLPDAVRLDIAGDGPEGPALRARAAGLGDRVRFLGDVPDEALPALYQAADLFVLPCNCRAEAFGTVLAEALASGLPCVTCEVGSGTSWVVRDGVTGRVVPPDDPAALAGAIGALAADPARRDAMAREARRDALARLSLPAMLAAADAAYSAAGSSRMSRNAAMSPSVNPSERT